MRFLSLFTHHDKDMHKKLSFKLMYKLFVVSLLCLLFSTEKVSADDKKIAITGNKIREKHLAISFEAQNFFAGKAIKFLNKGFTLQLNYTIELWKSRNLWFDEPVAQQKIQQVITYDIVRKEYSVFRKIGEKRLEKKIFRIEQVIDWATKFMDVEISQIEKLQNKSFYYYSIDAELKMLTTDDLKDLQRWFNDLESKRKSKNGSHALSDIFWGIIAEILSSQKAVELKTESEKFQIMDIVHTKPKK